MSEEDAETPESVEADRLIEIPKQWRKFPIADMIEKGWRPRLIRRKDKYYITLRFGDQERSLGRYTDERISLLQEMYPQIDWGITRMERPAPIDKASILKTKLSKPQPLKTQLQISLEVLNWYEWAQSKGYPYDLGTFISEIVHYFFQDQGLERPVIIRKMESDIRKEITPIVQY